MLGPPSRGPSLPHWPQAFFKICILTPLFFGFRSPFLVRFSAKTHCESAICCFKSSPFRLWSRFVRYTSVKLYILVFLRFFFDFETIENLDRLKMTSRPSSLCLSSIFDFIYLALRNLLKIKKRASARCRGMEWTRSAAANACSGFGKI